MSSASSRPIADPAQIDQLLDDLCRQIRAGSKDAGKIAFIGIRRRGDVLAARLAKKMNIADVGSIDITLYRDDLSETGAMARVGKTNIPFSVEGREIILCDDVIMTGRSVLAALREILDFGRPSRVHMAVLVERPEREIPVHPEFVALRLQPGPTEKVDVRLMPQDDTDGVSINTRA